jgi:hypothetical protein
VQAITATGLLTLAGVATRSEKEGLALMIVFGPVTVSGIVSYVTGDCLLVSIVVAMASSLLVYLVMRRRAKNASVGRPVL